jgi:hypothetical protein
VTTAIQERKDKNRIYIPQEKLATLVREVYNLSAPAGMGMLHYQPGPLPENIVQEIVENPRGIHMDYVFGRQCKMSVYKEGDQHYIFKRWHDHSESQPTQLLTALDLPQPTPL